MLHWDKPLTNHDIIYIIEQTPLREKFRGVFSRDELKTIKPFGRGKIEAGILNLSNSYEKGTHWTAWFKHKDNVVCYYDSYGDLPPPIEFIDYFKSNFEIYYNVERDQDFNTVICGQLCICFLFLEFLKLI